MLCFMVDGVYQSYIHGLGAVGGPGFEIDSVKRAGTDRTENGRTGIDRSMQGEIWSSKFQISLSTIQYI